MYAYSPEIQLYLSLGIFDLKTGKPDGSNDRFRGRLVSTGKPLAEKEKALAAAANISAEACIELG
jgi:hypothetical protein